MMYPVRVEKKVKEIWIIHDRFKHLVAIEICYAVSICVFSFSNHKNNKIMLEILIVTEWYKKKLLLLL